MSPCEAMLVASVTLLAFASWACWCANGIADECQSWMVEEWTRADIAESRAAGLLLTREERDLLDTLRRLGHLPPNGVKIIDGLISRHGGET